MKVSVKVQENLFDLTDKEYLFANHYLGEAGFNATKAARLAGYSKITARQIGYENLTKPYIKKFIQTRSSVILESIEITQEKVLSELAKIAFSNITEIFDNDWSLKQQNEIDPLAANAIKSIKKSGSGISVQMHDKIKALQILLEFLED